MATTSTDERRDQQTPSAAALVARAVLASNWVEDQRSYLDNFAPFVLDCLSTSEPRSRTEVLEAVAARFGIEIPSNVMGNLIKRLQKNGTVAIKDGAVLLVRPPGGGPLAKRSQEIQRSITQLTSEFAAFALEEFGVELADEAEKLLLDFVGEWTLPLFRGLMGRDERPGIPAAEERAPVDRGAVIAAFVLHIWENNPTLSRGLEKLVKGAMLTSALYLPDPGSRTRRFKDTRVFLDTPLLLTALGLASPEERDAARETLQTARELGALLRCFSETVDEIRRVIDYNILQFQNRKGRLPYRHVTSGVLASGVSCSDLIAIAASLPEKLADLGVRSENSPEWSERDVDLEHDLRDRFAHYQRDEPRDHDVQVLLAVHRLRGRHSMYRMEDSRAVLVTTNSVVVAAATSCSSSTASAPLAMIDDEFATLLWLKKPALTPDLPMRRVIADCHAALDPPDEVWGAYLDAVEKLIDDGDATEDDYMLIRADIETRRMVASRSGGQVEAVSGTFARQVLTEARDRIVSDARKEAAAEVDGASRAAAKRERAAAEREKAAAEQEKRTRADLEAELDASRNRADQVAKEGVSDERRIQASRIGNGVSRAVMLLVAAIVMTLLGLAFLVVEAPFVGVPPWVVRGATVLVAFVFVFSFFGVKPNRDRVRSVLDQRVGGWVEGRVLRYLHSVDRDPPSSVSP